MKLRSLLLPIAVVSLASCGPNLPVNPPMQELSLPMRLEMKRFDRGDMGLAVGARRIEGTDFIVQPKGQASTLPAAFLGPLAVFAQDAIMEKKLDDEDSLLSELRQIDLVKMCSDSARAKSFGKGWISDKPSGHVLRVESNGEFVQESKGVWSVGLLTSVQILDSNGDLKWGRAVGRMSPTSRTLADGWFKNDAAPLRSFLRSAFDETWIELNGYMKAGSAR